MGSRGKTISMEGELITSNNIRDLTSGMIPYVEKIDINDVRTAMCMYGRAVHDVATDTFIVSGKHVAVKIISDYMFEMKDIETDTTFKCVIARRNVYFLQPFNSERRNFMIPWYYDEDKSLLGFPIQEDEFESIMRAFPPA
jgi:hypothetical protein